MFLEGLLTEFKVWFGTGLIGPPLLVFCILAYILAVVLKGRALLPYFGFGVGAALFFTLVLLRFFTNAPSWHYLPSLIFI